MDYLTQVLGLQVTYLPESPNGLPNYIHSKYALKGAVLDGQDVVFLYPKDGLDSIDAIKKHLARVRETTQANVVIVPEHLTSRQRDYFIRERIPFVVEGKQIYLPFMAVYLQERGLGEDKYAGRILPSAQVLFLYYIYHGAGRTATSSATEALGFSPMSISRGSKQLEALGLVQLEKQGVQNYLMTDKSPKELFESATSLLRNPVKRTIYIPSDAVDKSLPESGLSALSAYSDLNPPSVLCMASDSIAKWEKAAFKKPQSTRDDCAVELWRYDPRKLTDGKSVDPLSLSLSLRDNGDERVEQAVEMMMQQVWRDIDGKRN